MRPTEQEIHTAALYLRVDQNPMTAFKKGVKFGIEKMEGSQTEQLSRLRDFCIFRAETINRIGSPEDSANFVLVLKTIRVEALAIVEDLNRILNNTALGGHCKTQIEMKQLEFKVYPSEELTITVEDDDIYGGAHKYEAKNSIGFNNGVAQYVESTTTILFVQKNDDGSMIPGLQSEQLALILLDRCVKLNNRFPSDYNAKMIAGLNTFLDACAERIKDRIDRGVMGELKK
ncbi:MAG: hypothetical protein WCK18_20275 [Prolixibacteraceae bacterium]